MITLLKTKQKQIKDFLHEQKIIDNIIYINSPYLITSYDLHEKIIENILTGEIIAQSIPMTFEDEQYLIKHWYKIPQDFNIYNFFQNTIQKNLSESSLNIDNYDLLKNFTKIIIFTTLGCNANCYYCYEKGKRDPLNKMSKQIADQFIKKMKGRNDHFSFHWFGGEPLFNQDIINYICDQCNKNNINFTSTMISNGLLFNKKNVEIAKDLWKLSSVQITIDGTEFEYEKIKDVPLGSFKTLLKNIHLLLKNNISVSVRLNVSNDNYEDLKKVIKILYINYKSYFSKFSINVHELFGYEKEPNIYDKCFKLELYIDSLFNNFKWNTHNWKSHNCMVDTGKAIAILPNGNITICEHDTDKNIVTNLNQDFYNIDVINKYAQQFNKESCQKCPVRPGCIFSASCCAHGGQNCSQARVEYIIKKKKKHLAQYAKKQRKRRKHLMITREMYKNLDIYNKATALIEAFNSQDGSNLNYPVKINFYLQKNMNAIIDLAKEIEQKRIEIIQKFGTKKENTDEYFIPEEKMEEASKELQDFFDLEQEVPINMMKLDWFDGIDMNAAQVAAISFMIEEEE